MLAPDNPYPVDILPPSYNIAEREQRSTMNPAAGQASQAQSQSGTADQQPIQLPMYQPSHIRSLPLLSEEEKKKYEQGLLGLWAKVNATSPNSKEQIAARNKIGEFSRMLRGKIQARRQGQGQQSDTPAARPPSAQQNPNVSGATGTSQAQSKTHQSQAAAALPQTQAATAPASAPPNANAPAATGTATASAAAAAAAHRPRASDAIMQHVSKMIFRPPIHIANKSPVEVAKWAEETREKYGRAFMAMESNRSKIQAMEKIMKDRTAAGKSFSEEEMRQYTAKREQHLKAYNEAHKWIDNVRKQQEGIQASQQQAGTVAGQNGATSATTGTQQTANTPSNATTTQNNVQPATQHVASANAAVNAAIEAAREKSSQLAAGGPRPPAAGAASSLATAPNQARPVPQPPQQTQGQSQAKTEQLPPPPVNTVQANAPGPNTAPRVATPQSATPVGPARPLTHSAAMTLANQRAASTPNSAANQGQQSAAVLAANSAVIGAVNQTGAAPQQGQQGHPHAHPSQTQTGFQNKMPIPKQLPEKATAIPQGVVLGGGVSAGRPTMSQGGGTLGGVMNQPAMTRIPAYSHDAEGDHVLSKKKLDELVRQVSGGGGDSQDGNLLTPEVEEVSK